MTELQKWESVISKCRTFILRQVPGLSYLTCLPGRSSLSVFCNGNRWVSVCWPEVKPPHMFFVLKLSSNFQNKWFSRQKIWSAQVHLLKYNCAVTVLYWSISISYPFFSTIRRKFCTHHINDNKLTKIMYYYY